MPYHKDKQQAFQAAQQGVAQAKNIHEQLDPTSPEYGHYVKQLKQEINEAIQQIENALEVASETQRETLYEYHGEINEMKQDVE